MIALGLSDYDIIFDFQAKKPKGRQTDNAKYIVENRPPIHLLVTWPNVALFVIVKMCKFR